MAHQFRPAARGGEMRTPLWAARLDEPAGPLSGPVVLMPRRIPGGVAAALDGLPHAALPRLHHEGPASGLRRALRAALAERLPRPRWLANWLLDDVLDHAALMAGLTGTAALRVSLDVGDGEPPAPFAAADARLRMVTVYRGLGTDWVSPRLTGALPPGGEPPAAVLRRLPRGDVAILRGTADAGGGAVLHRAATGAGGATLRLTIDEAGPAPASRAGRSGRMLQ